MPDPATGGLRAGVGEDYPNGGGNRAFLFTVDSPEGKLSFFVNNSASAFDLDKDVVVDGVSFGSPLGNLAAAMKDAGLTQVDAWIGTGGEPVAQMVVPVIHPKVYMPEPLGRALQPVLAGHAVSLQGRRAARLPRRRRRSRSSPQTQYFDKFVLTQGGVARDDNHAVKSAARLRRRAALQPVDARRGDRVASTSLGDDCGEGFLAPSPWANAFARLDRALLVPPPSR